MARVDRQNNGWSSLNLCDYWDGLQGIIEEAAELYVKGATLPLRRFSVFVTDLCNMPCRDCRVDLSSAKSMDLGWLSEQLAQAREMGAVFFDVMGLGEPTLMAELPGLLKTATAHGLICTIGTNGATTNLQKPDYLAELMEISPMKIRVSLDSADPKVHDSYRGGSCTWDRAVSFIQHVVRVRSMGNLKASLFINCVVRSSNLEQVLENIDFFANLGVDDVHLIPIRYVQEEFCSVDQILRFNSKTAPLIEEYALRYQLSWAAKNAYIFGRSEEEIALASRGRYYLPMQARDCYALKMQMVLDACRRPFTCLWGKRAKGRPIFETPVDDLRRVRCQTAQLSYLDINPEICQEYCTREVIEANDRIEELLTANEHSDGPR